MVDLKQTRNFNLTNEKIIEMRANFINNFGEAIMLNLDQNTKFRSNIEMGKRVRRIGIKSRGFSE